MKFQKVYKYRPILQNSHDVIRDLNCLETNTLYAPNIEQLNDPCETLVYTDTFNIGASFFQKILGNKNDVSFESVKHRLEQLIEKRNEIGIYSLTKSYKDELLWAHYSNSHYGYCIEYDLDLLLQNKYDDQIFHFPVEYSKKPPQIEFTDFSRGNRIIQKMTAFKSNAWMYESEYRIIFERFGLRSYNPDAVTGVYFGLRMSEDYKRDIMNRLEGRKISFFQMSLVDKSYTFDRVSINNPAMEEKTYLKYIPSKITGDLPVKYQIVENKYNWYKRKGTLQVQLEKEINENNLKWLGEFFKAHLFSNANIVSIYYNVDGFEKKSGCWGTSHYQDNKVTPIINSYN